MIRVALILLAISHYVSALEPCEPFGLRLYYGNVLLNQSSTEKAHLYFNTKESCEGSFANVISSEGFKRVTCEHSAITTSAFVDFYVAHVHKCSFTNIPYEDTFSYIAYGANEADLTPIPHKFAWVQVFLSDPRNKNRAMQLAALADWGPIKKNIGVMTPIIDDLNRVLKEKDIDVVLINGDVAYDLDSNNGTNYEDFLLTLEQVSNKIPIVHVPGNHERRTPDAALLFNTSFKVYGLDIKLATGLSLGSIFLLPFDPYNIIYGYNEPFSSLAALKTELARGVASERFIIPCSHYPLICSAESS